MPNLNVCVQIYMIKKIYCNIYIYIYIYIYILQYIILCLKSPVYFAISVQSYFHLKP